MHNEKHPTQIHQSAPLLLSSEERYELIAKVALDLEERKVRIRDENEQRKLWDWQDTEINFGDVISLYD